MQNNFDFSLKKIEKYVNIIKDSKKKQSNYMDNLSKRKWSWAGSHYKSYNEISLLRTLLEKIKVEKSGLHR